MDDLKIDRILFFTAAFLVFLVCLPMGLEPERAGEIVSQAYNWVASNLGFLYQWFAVGCIVFLLWLGLGRFGHIRLGEEDEQPEYSNFSWAGMLFCAGTGASLLVWAGVEWAFYYDSPPYGITARSTEAIEWGSAYGLFHWGIIAWCFYALPTVAIAYPFYVKKIPYLRASTALHSVLGPDSGHSALGRVVDLACMIALLGGAGSSLSMIAPTIAATVASLLGMKTSYVLELIVILFCITLFSLSVYRGLDKGIRKLSDLNIYLAMAFLGYVLLVGPTLFILKMSTDSIGFMLSNFARMTSWTDPVEQSGFVESWTIFYWAWWVAFAPPIGVFVTRISRGRTIRQVIFSMILFGSLGCTLFYSVLGSYSLSLELDGVMSVTGSLAEEGMFVTVANVLGTLPYSQLVLAVFALVSVISVATTYDSASYTLASTATRSLHEGDDPARWHRLFWAGVLGTLPIFMVFVGGLEVIRSGVLLASLPLLLVGVAMAFALVRSLRQH